MSRNLAIRITAALGFMAVALGAFGAHGLKDLLAQHQTTGHWEKAVFYHFVHVIVMLIVALRQPLVRGAWLCFLIGILVFSGSLYLLALTNQRWLGALTPVGGLSLLVGWIWLIVNKWWD